ncbi:MAG: T9SS type A sorting domain-containing protein [Candidatus Eisenbacteria bacterium]|nr:T9SS type A sorting domain-containing protein [Candidatus Eisenbacteria bacterium]
MTKMLTRMLGVAALLACTASSALAVQYPPGPGGLYPDTLTIENLQNSAAVPFLAVPDTVRGIGGIITGFDNKSSGYALYMQTSTGAPFSGIDVFFGAYNKSAAPYNLAIGDSIVVYGKKQEFQGETEIEGYDASQGTDDCIVRLVSSGNPLPPFFVGTTTQLRETPTNTTGEQYEGMLVRINQSGANTLKVARTVGLGTNAFILVDSAAPSDSVFIDGNTLATFPAPALGTAITYVQGIVNQRTRGYRIQLRDGGDIDAATPPNVTDAYPILDTEIRVVFDRPVSSATATDINNYSLASFGSVDAAVMDGTNAAVLTVTNGLPHGVNETVTVNNVAGAVNNIAMTSGQSRTFINGVLSCGEIQAANPDSLARVAGCVDMSRFAGSYGQTSQGQGGTRASMIGVMTGKYTPSNYLADEGGGQRSGLQVYAPPAPMLIGHKYLVVGAVQEFYGETEFNFVTEARDLGLASAPAPMLPLLSIYDHGGCDATGLEEVAEDYEATLLRVNYGKVILAEGLVTPPTNGFHISNIAGTDTIFVSNFNSVLNPFVAPPMGTTVQVTGILGFNTSFRIMPRSWADVVDLGVGAGVGANSPQVHFSVVQNPSARPRLAFGLPVASDVELGVYDVTGRKVATLQKGHLPAGEYSRAWDGSKAGPGVYFYRLTVNGQTYSTRSIKLQ